MKRVIVTLLLLGVLLLQIPVFSACGTVEEDSGSTPIPTPTLTPTPTTEPEPAWEWPESLKVRSLAIGGSQYSVMSSWAPVMEQDTGMKVRIIAESNYSTARKWVLGGTLDTGVNSMIEARTQYLAVDQWAARDGGADPRIRVIWMGEIVPYGYGVAEDSDIKTIYDLEGKKVGLPTGLAGPKSSMEGTLAWANLTWDDVEVVEFAGHPAHGRGMVEGKCDVAQILPASPVGIEAESSPKGLRYLEMDPVADPEGAARFWAVMPVQSFAKNTVGVDAGKDVTMFALTFFMTAPEDTDDDLIYNLSKWFDENFDQYQDKYILNPTMHIDTFREVLNTSYLPVHEGTIKYLKEVGKWDATDDARQQANIDLAQAYHDAFQSAIIEADKQEIKVDPENEEWIKFWENYRDNRSLPPIKLAD